VGWGSKKGRGTHKKGFEKEGRFNEREEYFIRLGRENCGSECGTIGSG